MLQLHRLIPSKNGLRLAHRLTFPILVLTTVSACATGHRSVPADVTPPRGGDAYLTVSNRHSHDIDVGFRTEFESETRLGTVRVHLTNDLTLPRTLNGAVTEIFVRCRRTGEVHMTRRIAWSPQQRFELLVPEILGLSRLTTR